MSNSGLKAVLLDQINADVVRLRATPVAKLQVAAILERTTVTPTQEIGEPPICLSVRNDGHTATLGTLGNISVVIGKAKSRKTFAVGAAIAAALTPGQLQVGRIEGHAPPDRRMVLYFDTEQSRYHVQRSLQRICEQAGMDDPPNLKVYSLRGENTADRLQAIEWAIYNIPGVFLVVIDGVRDLVYDINSPEEATQMATYLLRWSDERQVHIMTVLHQNKADQSARGHLGTELVNKAETVLSVTKGVDGDTMLSTVSAEQCRDREFEPFSFAIDEHGLPYPVDNPDETNGSGGSKKRELTSDEVSNVLRWVYDKETHLGYGKLRSDLIAGAKHMGLPLSKNDAETVITQAFHRGTLGKEKVAGKGYDKYFLAAA